MSESMKASASGMYNSTSLKRWQIQNLDYNYYWAFTVLLGWFGVDYWYLGAPLTGLLKMIVNPLLYRQIVHQCLIQLMKRSI